MPKYLFQATYTIQGEEGVRRKGGTDRRNAWADSVHGVGGELECLYFKFGDRDVCSIVDLPDNGRRGPCPDRQLLRSSDDEDDGAAHSRTDRRGGRARGLLPSAGALATSRNRLPGAGPTW
jgi:hypothetical protein